MVFTERNPNPSGVAAHEELQLGRDVNVPMRMCNRVGQEITEVLNRGWGERDAMVFTLLQQERAGISPVAVPRERIMAVLDRK